MLLLNRGGHLNRLEYACNFCVLYKYSLDITFTFPYILNISTDTIFSTHNLPSFRACSQMLASLSGYQYTRKAWRKEAFEMMLDPSFFQLDMRCINYWRSIIDNLMTHDKTTFKDLMSKFS